MATRQPVNSTRAAETAAPETPAVEETATPTAPAVETPTAPAMPERPDWTAPAHAAVANLAVEVKALNDLVTRHNEYTTAVDLYAGPLRTFIKNTENPSWGNSYRIASTIRADVEGWAALLVELNQNIAYVVHELVPDVLAYDLAAGDNLRKQLAKILDNADMFIVVADDTQVAANAVIAEWDKAKDSFGRATGKGNVRVVNNAGVSQAKTPSRGLGEMVRNRGFMLTMECDRCGDVLTSGSNKGSAQDAVANHFVTKHSEPRPRAGDQVHAGFTQAMNAVLQAPDADDVTAEGGTFTIGKRQVAA